MARLVSSSLLAATLTVWLAAPVGAVCVPTDPDCLEETVEEAGETVGGMVEDLTGTVDETVEQVEKVADDTVDTIRRIVAPPPGDVDPGDEDPPGGGSDGGSTSERDRNGGGVPGSGGGSGGGAPDRRVPSDPPVRFVDTQTPVAATAAAGVRDPSLLDSIGRRVRDAARGLAFPLVLLIAAAVFLAIQDRLDRKDPKLAWAPREPEVVPFA